MVRNTGSIWPTLWLVLWKGTCLNSWRRFSETELSCQEWIMDNKLGMRTLVIKASLYSEQHYKNYFEQTVVTQISANTYTK